MLRPFALLFFALSSISAGDVVDERLPLWSGQAPLGNGMSEPVPADCTITLHRAINPNGAAFVICPGGGYGGRVSGAEGHGIATWMNDHGITGVVLDYRLPKGRSEVPLLDAQRAIRLVRANAKAWGVDPKRIGIIGFSAGGHLAASACTLSLPGDAKAEDPVERVSSRPDMAILIYPVVSMQDGLVHGGSRANLLGGMPSTALMERFSVERQVNADTPPVYLAHAIDDKSVTIENSRVFVAAMKAAKRPAELLELPSGGHGLNGYKGPNWDAWQAGSLTWLAKLKFIPAQ